MKIYFIGFASGYIVATLVYVLAMISLNGKPEEAMKDIES